MIYSSESPHLFSDNMNWVFKNPCAISFFAVMIRIIAVFFLTVLHFFPSCVLTDETSCDRSIKVLPHNLLGTYARQTNQPTNRQINQPTYGYEDS